jgi:hypothetical protein
MEERVPRSQYPWWVKVSIMGVPGRVGLWAFVALSLAVTIASAIYAFWDQRFFYVVIAGAFATLMYWLSIRWIDRHGSWEDNL